MQRAIASYRSEPNKTYISSLDRLTEAMENLAVLTTQLSLKYAAMQKSMERATSVPKGQKDRAPRTKERKRQRPRTDQRRAGVDHVELLVSDPLASTVGLDG